MSQDYVKLKAREALSASNGNRREAGQLLRIWSETDLDLKKALVAPFLGNLCALAVQRAASTGGPRPPQASGRPDSESLLSTIGSNLAQTMSTTRQTQAPPPRSSSRHRQAVATLAACI
ncbi:MAG: hypothetical protein P8N43_09740 [Alphaproteobacteria bacterium]|jgi:hypothetical protein|nr:hypothetical protein [Alphaproteobacteria bacterium]